MIMLKNAQYLLEEGKFIKGDILLDGDKIHSLYPEGQREDTHAGDNIRKDIQQIDLKGRRVIPGLVDMHTHGAIGHDAMTASPAELCELACYKASHGVTSLIPTTVTDSKENIREALKRIKQAALMDYPGATIEGAHIEGPYINVKRKGAHDPNWIRNPKIADYDKYMDIIGDMHIHMAVAPEIDGGLEFIRYMVEKGGTVSIGHSDGTYDQTMEAIEAGASIFTHLYNAMRGIHHREPGVVGAALASDIAVEIICDGIHVHPAVVRSTIRAKGKDKVVLITDSMHAAGLTDGDYEFGGFKINVHEGQVRQEDGTLAGSTLDLFTAVKNAMSYAGISLEDAVTMATLNPARILGIDHKVGSIALGKRGDLVVLNENTEIDMVFCRGKQVV